MIDLTKPIRAIDSKEPLTVDVRLINGKGDYWFCEAKFLDGHYENIPEPRRPERFYSEGGELYAADGRLAISSKGIHLIEWPEGAPLPELPE